MNRWGKIKTLARVAPRRPQEVADRIANVVEARWDAWRSTPATCRWVCAADGERELTAKLLGDELNADTLGEELRDLDEVVQRRIAGLDSKAPIDVVHCAVGSLARTAYLLGRAQRPGVVIETGVAYGVTSRYILEALRVNGVGHLDSIDLPPLGDETGAHIGMLVEPPLRSRWTLHRGTTRRLLPQLVDRAGVVHMFVHDSLHTYRTMLWEFETVWPHLAPGGVLVSDDIEGNTAFEDFVARVSPSHSWAVHDRQEGGFFGVIIK